MNNEQLLKRDIPQQILSKTIGYGPAQFKLARPLNLLLFSEGCQSIVLGLLLPELSLEWGIGVYEKSLLISMVYGGVTLGSYIQTYSDKYGRHIFTVWDAILQTIFGLASCICPSFGWFIICRFFYGIAIGIVLPLSGSYIIENAPAKQRATVLSISRVFFSAGCIFTCIAGWIMLQRQLWRLLLFIICLPGMYALYDQVKNGKESFRYLWAKRDPQQIKDLLDYMAKQNNVKTLQLQEIKSLISQDKSPQKREPNNSINDLFVQKYRMQTYFLIATWFTICFVFYGVMLLLPSILAKNPQFSIHYRYLLLTCVSITQAVAFWITRHFVDHQDFGRKKTLYYGLWGIAIFVFMVILVGQKNRFLLFIFFVIIKFLTSVTFMAIYPFTSEIYETFLRGKAMGIMSCVGRIGTVTLGIAGVSAMEMFNGHGLYMLFILFSIISGYLIYKMPHETLGRAMDM